MRNSLLVTALFATISLFFSQLSLAEESPAFVARNAAIAQKAQSAQAEAVAAQKATTEQSGRDS